ncbi:hypothetical protein QVD17_04193 [Tagetes erecta]|uniref:Uncharacterized protein n=1 Tax=Tagetes erecta TaxID=13708 RepID=A0AAD8LJ46_TARER|nr:hypothetical protein QVD17_04193 [Tagetes erecta]
MYQFNTNKILSDLLDHPRPSLLAHSNWPCICFKSVAQYQPKDLTPFHSLRSSSPLSFWSDSIGNRYFSGSSCDSIYTARTPGVVMTL